MQQNLPRAQRALASFSAGGPCTSGCGGPVTVSQGGLEQATGRLWVSLHPQLDDKALHSKLEALCSVSKIKPK